MKTPGKFPEIFAPGIVSTDQEYQFGCTFSKNGDELYYAIRLDEDWNAEIRYTRIENGKWIAPRKLTLDNRYSYNDPLLSWDEKRLYFISNRPTDSTEPKDSDLWYIERPNTGWSEPVNLGQQINSAKNEYFISIARNGNLYFSSNSHTSDEKEFDHDIYRSKWENGSYTPPTRLSTKINSPHFEVDAFVSPDESYMIFCSTRPGGIGEGDLYISFKLKDNTWSQSINMGEPINSDRHEFCPFVSRDGKFLFYTSGGDIYWVSTQVINHLEKKK